MITRDQIYTNDNNETLLNLMKTLIADDDPQELNDNEIYVMFIKMINVTVKNFNPGNMKHLWQYYLIICLFHFYKRYSNPCLLNLDDVIMDMQETIVNYFSHKLLYQHCASYLFKDSFLDIIEKEIKDTIIRSPDIDDVIVSVKNLVTNLCHPVYKFLAQIPQILTKWDGSSNVIFDEEGIRHSHIPIPSCEGEYYYLHITSKLTSDLLVIKVVKKSSTKISDNSSVELNHLVVYNDSLHIDSPPITIKTDHTINPVMFKLDIPVSHSLQKYKTLAEAPKTFSATNHNHAFSIYAIVNQQIPQRFLRFQTEKEEDTTYDILLKNAIKSNTRNAVDAFKKFTEFVAKWSSQY